MKTGLEQCVYKTKASQVALVVKNPAASAGDLRDKGSIPGPGRSPGGGKGYPPQYSSLENPMGCIVHRVATRQTRLNEVHSHFPIKKEKEKDKQKMT